MDSQVYIVIVGIAAFWCVITYNRFIKRKNRLEEAWSGIDVQLKRRANLIPNLVETVKAYAKHERSTLDELTQLRTGMDNSESVSTRSDEESKVSNALRKLLAVAENYPELKANANFLELHNNLDEIEEQIQLARRYYNGSVRNWNTMIESFPSNLIANVFHFVQAEYFELEAVEERAVPEVKF